MVEHSTENAGVVSSILTLGTNWRARFRVASGSSSVVEHFLAKEGVGGSNPLSRSKRTIAGGFFSFPFPHLTRLVALDIARSR